MERRERFLGFHIIATIAPVATVANATVSILSLLSLNNFVRHCSDCSDGSDYMETGLYDVSWSETKLKFVSDFSFSDFHSWTFFILERPVESRTHYTRIFNFPLRNNVKISEHAPILTYSNHA